MAWAILKHSKSAVDRAGAFLNIPITEAVTDVPGEYFALLTQAFDVVNNWRGCHAFALNTMQILLRRMAASVDSGALIAQRLKRVESVIAKLRRFPDMNLSRMQDIGGCRAVVNSVESVKEVHAKFLKSKTEHEACGGRDYIENPKEDGYRGIHLIYKFNSKQSPEHSGRRIEIQLRSRLMHSWATAVETVDTLTDQSLKTAQGEEKWKTFFRYMGSVFAIAEKTPLVSGTPQDREELRAEVKKLNDELKVDVILTAYQVVSKYIDEGNFKHSHYFLLTRDGDKRSVRVVGYPQSKVEVANNEYMRQEKEFKGTNNQAVLVSVDSMSALKKAYPNYFGDSRAFVMHLRSFMLAKPGTTFSPLKSIPAVPKDAIGPILALFDHPVAESLLRPGSTVPPPAVPPPTVPPPTEPSPTIPS